MKPQSEAAAQAALVQVLRLHRVPFWVGLGGVRLTPREQVKAKRAGLDRGAPDLVMPLPPQWWGAHPKIYCTRAAIELKRADLAPKTDRGDPTPGVSPEQREWLDRLAAAGWWASVEYGLDAAVGRLVDLGYLPESVRP